MGACGAVPALSLTPGAEKNLVIGLLGVLFFLLSLFFLSRLPFFRRRYLQAATSAEDREKILPVLTPLEAALFIRNSHTVMLVALVSLLMDKVLSVSSLKPLTVRRGEAGVPPGLPEEIFLSMVSEGDGAFTERDCHPFFEALADGLIMKTWFSDKTMLRRYYDDMVLLKKEELKARGEISRPSDLLWALFFDGLEGISIRSGLLPEGALPPEGAPGARLEALSGALFSLYQDMTLTFEGHQSGPFEGHQSAMKEEGDA
ncbi:MAG: hypothetical protein RDV48_09070 [Candidatus Eremiobacteraeota bacterium]|nr:hypothetical protein [Candidatus Eremiobacteraeota bacterium]